MLDRICRGLMLLIRCALANGKIVPAAIKSDIRNIGMTKIFIVSIEPFPRVLPSSPLLCVNILLIDSLAIIYWIPHSYLKEASIIIFFYLDALRLSCFN